MKVALIGAGGIGEVHSNAYQHLDGVQIVAVADPIAERAEKIAKANGAQAFASAEELFRHCKPDFADVCVPSYLHGEVATLSMEQGLNVLCEKPIANDMDTARAMAAASKKHGVLFMVAHVIRFWPEYVRLKEAYDSGEFGELRSLTMSRMSQAPLWGSGWYLEPGKSGMAPFELHIHDTDFVNFLLGMPDEVRSASFEHFGTHTSYIKSRYIYKQIPALVEAEAGWFDSPISFSMTYRAIFERAVMEYQNDRLMIYPNGGKPYEPAMDRVAVGTTINLRNSGGTFYEIAYFADCVKRARQPEIITPEDAVNSLYLLEKEIESASTGEQVCI